MERRIQNLETLLSTGNVKGRKAALEILEAGLQACDPYNAAGRLVRVDGDRLIVGCKEFEPEGDPNSGDEVYRLSEIDNIYFLGAGKGVQRVAKAFEDILGDRLAGGHVIDKKEHPVILDKIGVTLGSHPAPDEDCVRGCERILEFTKGLTERDLVFTCVGNGVSSLLTMPVPGVTIDETNEVTRVMQIERGVPTGDLNPIRNHIDMMKGGRISSHIHPAKMVHILSIEPGAYDQLIHRNLWLATLPDFTTYQMAIDNLHRWDAWDAVPDSVRRYLEKADPENETVRASDFEKMSFRIFGLLPGSGWPAAMNKAEELGFKPLIVARRLMDLEASQAGMFMADMARTIEALGQPVEPPCALFNGGEIVVMVGDETGIGGRHQEMPLAAAGKIAGSNNIVMASVDTDGTDGPGTQFVEGFEDIPCLGGGIVDGDTWDEAQRIGVNVVEELKRHNTTPPMLKLRGGIEVTPNISVGNLTVTLVMGRGEWNSTVR
jgi:glycerate-2-kinase